ncbi:hypothetical protein [Roseobacter weihaiensis]|uniref:hypothetical protein n=1 Tax=Roseobacter weihaiensis TaxID=2763262 RepID=UPI001D0AD72F|nr:hypothetical protein [Roseobacter sp. H9]
MPASANYLLGSNQGNDPISDINKARIFKWLSGGKDWVKTLSEDAVAREVQNEFPELDEKHGELALRAAIAEWAQKATINFPAISDPVHPADLPKIGLSDRGKSPRLLKGLELTLSKGLQMTPGESMVVVKMSGASFRPFMRSNLDPTLTHNFPNPLDCSDYEPETNLKMNIDKSALSSSYNWSKQKAALDWSSEKAFRNSKFGAGVTHDFKEKITEVKLSGQVDKFHLKAVLSEKTQSFSLIYPTSKAHRLSRWDVVHNVARMHEASNSIFEKARNQDVRRDPKGFYDDICKEVKTVRGVVTSMNEAMKFYSQDRPQLSVSFDVKLGDFNTPDYARQPVNVGFMPEYNMPSVGTGAGVTNGWLVGFNLHLTF